MVAFQSKYSASLHYKAIFMKRFFLVTILAIFSVFAMQAQQGPLMIKSGSKGLYLEHKVATKENFYSIGRLYNTPPKELGPYNGLDITKGLSLGQVINIPLSSANFSQTANAGTPVYYLPAAKEGLFRASTNNNNVTVEKLREWNKLTGDNIPAGANLIVGFLQSAEMKSVAVAVPGKPVVKNVPKPVAEEPVVKKEVVVPPPVKIEETKPVIIEEKKPDPPVVVQPVKQVEKPAVKEEPKYEPPVVPQPKAEIVKGTGYFKSGYELQIKRQPAAKELVTGAGIFKTTSGWSDGKYYLLIDNVPSGTIVKISNPTNNKIIYAKVLGEMAGIRQNSGLDIRISNAAAAALEIPEQDKFIVKVNYVP
jgi:LysM repeat protein